MEHNEKIEAAARLLEEWAKGTTNETAFKVIKRENDILLEPDKERRLLGWKPRFAAFHHLDKVVDVCRVFHLNNYVVAWTGPEGEQEFQVHIF